MCLGCCSLSFCLFLSLSRARSFMQSFDKNLVLSISTLVRLLPMRLKETIWVFAENSKFYESEAWKSQPMKFTYQMRNLRTQIECDKKAHRMWIYFQMFCYSHSRYRQRTFLKTIRPQAFPMKFCCWWTQNLFFMYRRMSRENSSKRGIKIQAQHSSNVWSFSSDN